MALGIRVVKQKLTQRQSENMSNGGIAPQFIYWFDLINAEKWYRQCPEPECPCGGCGVPYLNCPANWIDPQLRKSA